MTTTDTRRYHAPIDRKGDIIIVVVHRYHEPHDAWGIHELELRPAGVDDDDTRQDQASRGYFGHPMAKFASRTVGLFMDRPVLTGFVPFTKQSAAQAAASGIGTAEVLKMSLLYDELMEHIGRGHIPIEWQQQWRENDPTIRSWVEVYV